MWRTPLRENRCQVGAKDTGRTKVRSPNRGTEQPKITVQVRQRNRQIQRKLERARRGPGGARRKGRKRGDMEGGKRREREYRTTKHKNVESSIHFNFVPFPSFDVAYTSVTLNCTRLHYDLGRQNHLVPPPISLKILRDSSSSALSATQGSARRLRKGGAEKGTEQQSAVAYYRRNGPEGLT